MRRCPFETRQKDSNCLIVKNVSRKWRGLPHLIDAHTWDNMMDSHQSGTGHLRTPLKYSQSFSFRLAHHSLGRGNTGVLQALLALPKMKEMIRERFHFSGHSAASSLIAPGNKLVRFGPNKRRITRTISSNSIDTPSCAHATLNARNFVSC
jgi:hypothetical protein